MSDTALVWFRQDLRLADNPALADAVKSGLPVVALYVLDDDTPGVWKHGGAHRWWLHYSLEALAASLETHGVTLILQHGKAEAIVPRVACDVGAKYVAWNDCYEPYAGPRDKAIRASLEKAGLAVETHVGSLLMAPGSVLTGGKTPFRVFTPFWRALRTREIEAPLPVPRGLHGAKVAAGDDLASWKLLPIYPDWAGGMRDTWKPGEAEGRRQFNAFCDKALADYPDGRNLPSQEGSSRLSPYLHHGEVSPRQVWHGLLGEGQRSSNAVEKYLSELAWREFNYNILTWFPHLPTQPFDATFKPFEWHGKPTVLHAWQRGQTGYPFIDAGMRQLWQTGWMHNRARLATGSFLVKHLNISWVDGEKWFWDTLVDGDLANNAANWQWVAGCGADASPFFRIFNPILQSRKFDAKGAYIRRYVPELARLSDKDIHAPWEASEETLAKAGILLDKTYPRPIVDHAEARKAALSAYRHLSAA